MKNIEVKNEEMALSYETGETLEASDIYLSIVGGHATYTTFPMTKKMLELYGLDSYTVVHKRMLSIDFSINCVSHRINFHLQTYYVIINMCFPYRYSVKFD